MNKCIVRGLLVFTACLVVLNGNPLIADDCQSSGNLKYICGPINAEDILSLGDTKWLIASSIDGQLTDKDYTSHIYLVNQQDKTFEELFPGENPNFHPDKKMFDACPSPINPERFAAHGLALKQISSNRFHLYVTSHGEREAIEVFAINSQGAKPAISWTGCVLLPENMFSNSVAILSDGGFVATKFMDPIVPDSFNDIFQGKITGCIYEWHPGGIVKAIKGTELSGANGIELSPDDNWVFAAATGTREIVRFKRTESPATLEKVQVNILPDNIRWGDDGMLYTTGENYVPPADCDNAPCETGWSVISIDPQTMKIRRITGVDQTATMQNPSAAIPVGNSIWIGTHSGDRIGYLPRP